MIVVMGGWPSYSPVVVVVPHCSDHLRGARPHMDRDHAEDDYKQLVMAPLVAAYFRSMKKKIRVTWSSSGCFIMTIIMTIIMSGNHLVRLSMDQWWLFCVCVWLSPSRSIGWKPFCALLRGLYIYCQRKHETDRSLRFDVPWRQMQGAWWNSGVNTNKQDRFPQFPST